MSVLESDLNDRKRQVRHYLMMVARADRAHSLGSRDRIEEGRVIILRAGVFLILYNMIEATMRSVVETIHDDISKSGVTFTQLKQPVRKFAISSFKKLADPDRHHTMMDFSAEFITVALTLDVNGAKMSGGVDAREIREYGNKYGFSSKTSPITLDGSDLRTIKQTRNDLAHGHKTFEEVGRDYTAGQLIMIARRAMQYMTEITNNVTVYLEKKDYLEYDIEHD